jgi:hypothetical protein
MASAGIEYERWGATPFLAVLDREGRLVGMDSGAGTVHDLARWLRRAGAEIPLEEADGPEAVVEAEAAAVAARATPAGWAVLHRNDRMEIAADTLGYTRASDPATGTAFRTLVRYRLVRRTPEVAELWDMGARVYLYDQAVFCGLDGATDRQVHRAVAVGEDGRMVTPLVAHDAEWVTPRPGSPDATLGRALCGLLKRVDRGR